MKKRISFLAALLWINAVNAQSCIDYYTYKSTSLDVITNPSSIVMGESFIANPYSTSSFIENPANLSASKELGIFYNYRTLDWMELTKNYNFTSIGGSTHSSWGLIGFSVNQFSTGANSITLYTDLTSQEINRTYSLALAKPVLHNLLIGVALKIFNHSKSGEGFQSNIESNNAYLLDLGLRYQIPIAKTPSLQHEVNLGAVIQNLGTNYKEKDSFFSDEYKSMRLPRYVKIGFAYNIQLKNSVGNNDVEANFTGQYKNLLNPLGHETADVDYWGAGAEIIIKEIFAVRAGFIQLPEYVTYFERAKPILRYGFGFTLPFEKIGIHLPLIISADYSFIPIKSSSMFLDASTSNTLMHAIGFTIRYKSMFF